MVKLSRIPLDHKKMEQLYDDFFAAIASLESEEEVKYFLYDLLTDTERKVLIKRLQIALLLVEGKDYANIREELKVSDGTISKVSNWLQTGATTLEKIVKRIIADKNRGERENDNFPKDRYLAGDLLLPAIDAGTQAIKSLIKKKTRR